MRSVIIALFGLLALATVASAAGSLYEGYSFEQFLTEYKPEVLISNMNYAFHARKAIFEANLAKIRSHNSADHSWTLAVNQFADLTEKEFVNKFTGKSSTKGPKATGGRLLGAGASDLSVDPVSLGLPESFDWRETEGVMSPVKNQGGCGSCWAFASTATFESHAFLATGKSAILSTQQVTSCTPNPRKCGGTGGCFGATNELAFDYIAKKGITTKSAYPDTSDSTGATGTCKYDAATTKPVFKSTGYQSLQSNNATQHYEALVNKGPIGISIAANDLMFYSSGIFSGCPTSRNLDVNHAVVLNGYGIENGVHYWTVRNSWGKGWGEGGYIRVKRNPSGEPCGKNTTPEHGSACEGDDLSPVTTCGVCGVLVESSYPTGIELA